MRRLLEIGFVQVGYWQLRDGSQHLELTDAADRTNVLYAFICEDVVLYIGKTSKTLRSRLLSYIRPSDSQCTNARNSRAIRYLLCRKLQVGILALPNLGLHRYGEFEIDFAAALEDSIIQTLAPPWNGIHGTFGDDDEGEPTGRPR